MPCRFTALPSSAFEIHELSSSQMPPTSPTNNHDLLAQRLTQILIKLNQGEALTPTTLAAEFGVNLRTIQRDLNTRLGFLPLEKSEGRYRLQPSALGQLTLQDLRRFASLAGVQGLFPDLSPAFLRELFDHRVEQAWIIKGPAFEGHSGQQPLFKQLETATLQRQPVGFTYTKAQLQNTAAPTANTYEPVHPYKLVNHSGVWYLAAEHQGQLKAFALSKIERLLTLPGHFEPQAELLQMLQDEDSIWLNVRKTSVVLHIAPPAAPYFERRKLMGSQVIEKRLEDGGLMVSTQVAHPNQILPIVRYWIPHVRIVSPEGLQWEMETQLLSYLKH